MEEQFEAAVRGFWEVRDRQAAKQIANGSQDAGTRGAVTGGAHLDALTRLVVHHFVEKLGFPESSVWLGKKAELPGYYRPTKQWDLVVKEGDQLVAAIEFKSQSGSFGNNFNNRTEEAIGSAVDTRRAISRGLLGEARPWLGYVFLLEDAPGSTKNSHRAFNPRFEVDNAFKGNPSYADRYQVLCKRLVEDELYDAACFVLAPKDPELPISQPDSALSFRNFIESLTRHVESEPGLQG
ncbi:PaeR7I family type II restriction endonuclease [Streptomyces telluris]|uniref:PaeR7I family type II restriction endonuclease n=1 Tax=Streptomyces telluris TaxID=2720021 RepID=A0A9X2LND3_9ACTN|nr:PaeR7I family type II restriction endonuclease [Streptomyces telluris]MCQ8774037.1 PaeR7I family type II restriction endonuclease [Streptomyces telluris]NJP80140.1 restriction endonuclease [Streptomyces telluris]